MVPDHLPANRLARPRLTPAGVVGAGVGFAAVRLLGFVFAVLTDRIVCEGVGVEASSSTGAGSLWAVISRATPMIIQRVKLPAVVAIFMAVTIQR
jgi:hypothetical protein